MTSWTVCSLPDSSVHGISQARVLEWVAISFFLNKKATIKEGTSENQRKHNKKKVDKYISFAPEFSQLYLTVKTEIIILSDMVLNMWKKYLRWLYYKWVEDEGYKGK